MYISMGEYSTSVLSRHLCGASVTAKTLISGEHLLCDRIGYFAVERSEKFGLMCTFPVAVYSKRLTSNDPVERSLMVLFSDTGESVVDALC